MDNFWPTQRIGKNGRIITFFRHSETKPSTLLLTRLNKKQQEIYQRRQS